MYVKQKMNLRKNEKGQAMVEFALVVPIVLLLLLGIIEFGWLFNGQITMTSAAGVGARMAALPDNSEKFLTIDKDEAIKQAIEDNVEGLSGFKYLTPDSGKYYSGKAALEGAGLTPSEASAAVVEDAGKGTVTVYIRGNFKPLIGLFVGPNKDLWGQSTMNKEL